MIKRRDRPLHGASALASPTHSSSSRTGKGFTVVKKRSRPTPRTGPEQPTSPKRSRTSPGDQQTKQEEQASPESPHGLPPIPEDQEEDSYSDDSETEPDGPPGDASSKEALDPGTDEDRSDQVTDDDLVDSLDTATLAETPAHDSAVITQAFEVDPTDTRETVDTLDELFAPDDPLCPPAETNEDSVLYPVDEDNANLLPARSVSQLLNPFRVGDRVNAPFQSLDFCYPACISNVISPTLVAVLFDDGETATDVHIHSLFQLEPMLSDCHLSFPTQPAACTLPLQDHPPGSPPPLANEGLRPYPLLNGPRPNPSTSPTRRSSRTSSVMARLPVVPDPVLASVEEFSSNVCHLNSALQLLAPILATDESLLSTLCQHAATAPLHTPGMEGVFSRDCANLLLALTGHQSRSTQQPLAVPLNTNPLRAWLNLGQNRMGDANWSLDLLSDALLNNLPPTVPPSQRAPSPL